jgi:hypothetical protein
MRGSTRARSRTGTDCMPCCHRRRSRGVFRRDQGRGAGSSLRGTHGCPAPGINNRRNVWGVGRTAGRARQQSDASAFIQHCRTARSARLMPLRAG